MADYMPAEIWIGGKVPRSLVPDLCAEITKQGVSREWAGARFEPASKDDLLSACQVRGDVSVMFLCDEQARWGQFDALENYLQEHEIAFTRYSDGRYEYDPEMVEFRPGIGIFSRPTNKSGETVISVSYVTKLDQALQTARQQPTQSTMIDAIGQAEQLLREVLPRSLPSLEPFQIVEG